MSEARVQDLPLWLPVISVKADDAVGILSATLNSVQRNKRLSRAADYLLHVSVSSVASATIPEAAQLGGKVIGLVHFVSSKPVEEQEGIHLWQAEQPWRFANPFPWKGAPGTFRVPLSPLYQHLNALELAVLQARLNPSSS